MTKLIFLLVAALVAPSLAAAQKAVRFQSVVQRPEAKKPDLFKAIFYVSQDFRFERNENMGYSPRRLMSLGFGLRFRDRYLGMLEGGSFNDTTGVGNVRVDRKFETVNISGALMTQVMNISPYVGLGAGMARDTADIVIDGLPSNSRSGWEPLSHFFGGVRFFPRTYAWFSVEAKFVVGPRVDPNPAPGILFRLGAEL
jgi:hypothetical protein